MPRAHSQRRQEIRYRRRQTRRSLNQLLYDDGLASLETDWAEPAAVESIVAGDKLERILTLAPPDGEDE